MTPLLSVRLSQALWVWWVFSVLSSTSYCNPCSPSLQPSHLPFLPTLTVSLPYSPQKTCLVVLFFLTITSYLFFTYFFNFLVHRYNLPTYFFSPLSPSSFPTPPPHKKPVYLSFFSLPSHPSFSLLIFLIFLVHHYNLPTYCFSPLSPSPPLPPNLLNPPIHQKKVF